MSLKDRHAGKVVYASVAAAAPGDARTAWSASDEERESQPRVPIIGLDSGCIPGTRPGCSARELERAGRDIVRARLSRRRFKPA